MTPFSQAHAEAAQAVAQAVDGVNAIRERLTKRDPSTKTAVSMCYPLAVNNLMTRAMNRAAAAGWDKVTAEVIKAI